MCMKIILFLTFAHHYISKVGNVKSRSNFNAKMRGLRYVKKSDWYVIKRVRRRLWEPELWKSISTSWPAMRISSTQPLPISHRNLLHSLLQSLDHLFCYFYFTKFVKGCYEFIMKYFKFPKKELLTLNTGDHLLAALIIISNREMDFYF